MTAEIHKGWTGYAFDADALLEQAGRLGCQQAEVYETGVVTTPVSFENNQLKSVETAETAVVAVRVIKDGRLGFATSSKAGDDAVVEMAARSASFGPEATFDLAGAAPVRGDLKLFDAAVADWAPDRMLAAGEELVEFVRGLEEGVLAGASVEKHIGYTRVSTSGGQDVSSTGTAFVLFASGELVEPDNMIHFWRFTAGRNLALDLEALKRDLGSMFRHARRNVQFRTGSYPVIFSPMAGADLIAPMAACVDGMAVVKGESPWRDKVGQKLLSDEFTVYDDPTRPWGLRSAPFDDEGIPTAKRAIIERGVLRDFLLDLRAAKALNRSSTGNGFRPGPQSIPVPRASNIVVEPGSRPLAELIAGIKEGVYVERLMGAWAGNPYAGQVSGNIHIGFKIENGEITGRIKNAMASVSVFDAFRDQLAGLSRETDLAHAGLVLPHILLDGVSVSTKA